MSKAIKSLQYRNPQQSAARTTNFFRVGKQKKLIDNSYGFALPFVQHKKPIKTERRLRRKQNRERNRELREKRLLIKPNLNQEVRV